MLGLKDSRVLITGGSGFIGSNIARNLISKGAKVHIISRPNSDRWRLRDILEQLTLHEGDISDAIFVRHVICSVKPDYIIHCAIFAGHPRDHEEEREALKVRALGTLNLLHAVQNIDLLRFVNIGSSLEYGNRPYPLTEKTTTRPTVFRGVTSAIASLLCGYFARARQSPIVTLRPFTVYGPWDSPRKFIPTVLRAALWGGEVPLTLNDAFHDFVFIYDVVDACLKAMTTNLKFGEVINIGTGKQWSNRQVVELVESIVKKRIPVNLGAHPGNPTDTRNWVACIKKAEQLLGWQPQYDLPKGLRKTMKWLKQHTYALPNFLLGRLGKSG
jgi:nucleoside-diphosphate-sugar epimerase